MTISWLIFKSIKRQKVKHDLHKNPCDFINQMQHIKLTHILCRLRVWDNTMGSVLNYTHNIRGTFAILNTHALVDSSYIDDAEEVIVPEQNCSLSVPMSCGPLLESLWTFRPRPTTFLGIPTSVGCLARRCLNIAVVVPLSCFPIWSLQSTHWTNSESTDLK